jgi:hypothetical protein
MMQSVRLCLHVHIVVHKVAHVWPALVSTEKLIYICCTALGMFIDRFCY